MNKAIYVFLLFIFFSCSTEEETSICYPQEQCSAQFWIDPLVSPGVYEDENGYWHIEHQGYNYFTIKGQLSEAELAEVNGVPLVETIFDSNYWVWINGITFTVPLYSVLGYFTGGGYNNPIPVGNLTYTIEEMAQTHPPLNIVGYQINPNQCLDCPYSPTLIGTRSKYNYTPQQQIFFDNQMKGDTAKIMIQARFGEMSDEIIETEFNIIFN
jgi:hypothetical protein|tara:strand:+ start:277 stop:912 length:636 start_codon:yes stop_codon:yes gene_type:complete